MGHATDLSVLVVSASPCIDRYAWFDSFVLGIPNRPRRVEARPGGKALNASRVLRRLGVAVTVIVPLDSADRGWWAERAASDGLSLVATPAHGLIRVSMTCIDERERRATEIYEPNIPLALEESQGLVDAVGAALSTSRPLPSAVAVCGSRPGSDTGAFARIVGQCREAGVDVYVDSHGTPVLGALHARPTVVKVNLDEARELVGADAAPTADEAAEALVAAGAGVAVVTAGERGGACFDGERAYRIPPPARRAPFPGGSGDAFLAGLIAARTAGQPLEQALDYARRCGEANAESPYAGWVPEGFSRGEQA